MEIQKVGLYTMRYSVKFVLLNFVNQALIDRQHDVIQFELPERAIGNEHRV